MDLQINTEAALTFIPPFDIANSSTVFKVISISDISEMELNGLDPFGLVYDKVGLTKADMYADISNDVKILTLKTDGGYLYVPSSYINESSLVQSGVEYNKRALIFQICALPANESLGTLLTNIRAVITDELGIVPVGEEVVMSSNSLVSTIDHDSYEMERLTLRKSVGNYKTRVRELEALIAQKDEHIAKLNCLMCSNSLLSGPSITPPGITPAGAPKITSM